MRIAHPKTFPTLKIPLTAMEIWIIQIESEDNCEVDDESDIEPCTGIKAWECPEHGVVSTAPNVPGLICPIWKSMRQAEKGW